ncbi:PaaI family thioesterase [Gordonia sp. NPDC003376]
MTTTTSTEFVVSGAEALLRVDPVHLSATSAELSMAVGPWLTDPVAGMCRGAFGVPLDDVTGYVIASGAPQGKWPVSLGIRVDFLADPHVDGRAVSVTGELVARDDRGGTTRGSVVDATGATIALITQRSHLVAVDHPPTSTATTIAAPSSTVTVREALGVRDLGAGIVEMAPTPFVANGMRNIHGGMLIVGSELAAMSAVDAHGELRTTSIDISYVRPGDAGDVTTFRSEVLHRGRSLMVVRVAAANSSGKPCALATVVLQRYES